MAWPGSPGIGRKTLPVDETVVGGALIAFCTPPREMQYKHDYGYN